MTIAGRPVEAVWRHRMRHVAVPSRPGSAEAAAALRETREGFGFAVPPVTVHLVDDALTVAVSRLLRAILTGGRVARADKECVAAVVSTTNACPFCVGAHTMYLHAAGGGPAAAAIRDGRLEEIADPRLRDLALWAAANRSPRDPRLAAGAPVAAAEVPEVVGTAVAFTYFNRIANAFLPDTPLPVPARAPGAGLAERVARLVARGSTAARAPHLTPPGPFGGALPDGCEWARGDRTVADAVVAFDAALEARAARLLDPRGHGAVVARVARWDGEDPPLGRAWLDEALDGGGSVAALALLAALASYRIDDAAVAAARAEGGLDDTGVLGIVAWGSWLAARRVGGWIWPRPVAAAEG